MIVSSQCVLIATLPECVRICPLYVSWLGSKGSTYCSLTCVSILEGGPLEPNQLTYRGQILTHSGNVAMRTHWELTIISQNSFHLTYPDWYQITTRTGVHYSQYGLSGDSRTLGTPEDIASEVITKDSMIVKPLRTQLNIYVSRA
jgi:hypothetical protein